MIRGYGQLRLGGKNMWHSVDASNQRKHGMLPSNYVVGDIIFLVFYNIFMFFYVLSIKRIKKSIYITDKKTGSQW